MSTTYRRPATRERPPDLVLRPIHRGHFIVLAALIAIAPLTLFLLLWSRVVTVECGPSSAGTWRCNVDERSLVWTVRRTIDIPPASEVRLSGASRTARGDAFIVALTPAGERIQITSPFAGDKGHQWQVATDLQLLLDGADPRPYRGRFGRRWSSVPIVVLGLLGAALVAAIARARATVRFDPEHGLVVVDASWFLHRARGASFDPRNLEDVTVVVDAARRAHVHAALRDGPSLRLFRSLAPERDVARIQAWLDDVAPRDRA